MRKSTQLERAHPTTIICPHRPPCPGCPAFGRVGIAPTTQTALTRIAARSAIRPGPVVEGPPLGFRHRARLAVRGRAASPKIGIFQRESHRIADIPRCPIHHPLVNRVAAAVKDAMRQTGTAPYADRPHRGVLRYLQVVVGRADARAQVVLVGNDRNPQAVLAVARQLEADLAGVLHSLWWNGNPERGNAILGEHWHRFIGPTALRERIGGANVYFPPGAFGQANVPLIDALVSIVHAHVPDGAHVVEFYAGTGGFGLGLLGRAAAVAFNEANAHAVEGLRTGLAALPTGTRERASVHAGPAAEHAQLVEGADVVIADPPRKGLDDAVCSALTRRRPARLVLVSCDVRSLERDTARLGDGGLQLRSLEPLAMFPYTEHVETVAVFEPG